MTIDQATNLISSSIARMNNRYGKVLFNEWAIISLANNKASLIAYEGPRKAKFLTNFLRDAGSLRGTLLRQEHYTGDFEFARDGVGTGFEAFINLGKGVYLICNNTVQSMDGLTKDPLWLGAQIPFVDLSEQFRSDSLVAISGRGA